MRLNGEMLSLFLYHFNILFKQEAETQCSCSVCFLFLFLFFNIFQKKWLWYLHWCLLQEAGRWVCAGISLSLYKSLHLWESKGSNYTFSEPLISVKRSYPWMVLTHIHEPYHHPFKLVGIRQWNVWRIIWAKFNGEESWKIRTGTDIYICSPLLGALLRFPYSEAGIIISI